MFYCEKKIRDIFDIEFLYKKGIKIKATHQELKKILKGIEALTKKDYSVKLGSLVEQKQKQYYKDKNFILLKNNIQEILE